MERLKGKLLSLNVGMPQYRFVVQGRPVATAIYKFPVEGPILLRGVNLDGDAQADLKNHGGPDKAVYCYPSENYPFWRGEFPEMEMPWGTFGENLTTVGLREDEVQIDDRFRVGTAVIEVSQPRYPCSKLAMKFGRPDMIRRFLHSGRPGIYFRVVKEGVMEAGNEIEQLEGERSGISVCNVVHLANGEMDRGLISKVLDLPRLPFFWKERILELARR
jgi:MOSC domain-containing protein YiiM